MEKNHNEGPLGIYEKDYKTFVVETKAGDVITGVASANLFAASLLVYEELCKSTESLEDVLAETKNKTSLSPALRAQIDSNKDAIAKARGEKVGAAVEPKPPVELELLQVLKKLVGWHIANEKSQNVLARHIPFPILHDAKRAIAKVENLISPL